MYGLEEHAAHVMAAAARAYGSDVLAEVPPADDGAGETEAVGRQLFGLIFRGRTPDGQLLKLLTAGADPLDRELWKFVHGVLHGLPELRPEVRDTLAEFYRREADRGDVRAMIDLGDMLRFDDPAGSRDAYERAVASGDAHSQVTLADLLSEGGDTEGALRCLRQAIAGNDPDVKAEALVTLGRVLYHSDPAAAQEALRQAIETRHPEWAPAAMSGLGDLLKGYGDHAGARAAYQMAIEEGGPGWAAAASESLGALLEEQGDIAGAKAAYLRSATAADDHWGLGAFWSLRTLLSDDGDVDGLRALHRDMVTGGRTAAAAEALVAIGDLLTERGDTEGARIAYRQATDAGHELAADRLSPPDRDAFAAPDDLPGGELPAQFDPRNAAHTGAQVLEDGLPALPERLSYQMAIPAAYWADGQCAVVLFLMFSGGGGKPHPMGIMITYERGADGWTAHRHNAGTRFSYDPIASPDDPRYLDGRYMTVDGGSNATEVTPGHPAAVRTGGASRAVKYIALIQDGREDRRPLESHFGAWVVCTQSQSPFLVAGYDENGTLLTRVG